MLLRPGAKDSAASRAAVYRKCGFDKLGFATADEIAATISRSETSRAVVLLSPMLYQWLLSTKADATVARYLTRRLAGLKADLPSRLENR